MVHPFVRTNLKFIPKSPMATSRTRPTLHNGARRPCRPHLPDGAVSRTQHARLLCARGRISQAGEPHMSPSSVCWRRSADGTCIHRQQPTQTANVLHPRLSGKLLHRSTAPNQTFVQSCSSDCSTRRIGPPPSTCTRRYIIVCISTTSWPASTAAGLT